MNDHELLKLAAKAAGIEIEPCTCSDPKWPFRLAHGFIKPHWNPIEDDADALRLAVHLRLIVCPYEGSIIVDNGLRMIEEHDLSDRAAATRRAITRAAADVGKAMP